MTEDPINVFKISVNVIKNEFKMHLPKIKKELIVSQNLSQYEFTDLLRQHIKHHLFEGKEATIAIYLTGYHYGKPYLEYKINHYTQLCVHIAIYSDNYCDAYTLKLKIHGLPKFYNTNALMAESLPAITSIGSIIDSTYPDFLDVFMNFYDYYYSNNVICYLLILISFLSKTGGSAPIPPWRQAPITPASKYQDLIMIAQKCAVKTDKYIKEFLPERIIDIDDRIYPELYKKEFRTLTAQKCKLVQLIKPDIVEFHKSLKDKYYHCTIL